MLLPVISRMDDEFLQSYKDILKEKNIDTFNANDLEFVEEELQTVLSAVVVLLRRHRINGRLCCDNNDNNLEVTDVDRWGFVTQVKCNRCSRTLETTYHKTKRTYERIDDKSKLKPGDHICWHRWYVIWHHAIVSEVDGNERKIIHYYRDSCCDYVEVIERPMPKNDSSCNALYRVNYHDCYNADYSILRAQKLINKTGYNLLTRNCEHFSRWCKTGTTNSIQVDLCCTSLLKLALMIVPRLIFPLVIILCCLHEPLLVALKENCIKVFDTCYQYSISCSTAPSSSKHPDSGRLREPLLVAPKESCIELFNACHQYSISCSMASNSSKQPDTEISQSRFMQMADMKVRLHGV